MFNIFVKQGKLLLIILVLAIANLFIKSTSIINWIMVVFSLLLLSKTFQINMHIKKAKKKSGQDTLYLAYQEQRGLIFRAIPNFYTLKGNRLITVNETPRTSIKISDDDVKLIDDYIKNMLVDKHYYKKALKISVDNLIVERIS